MDRLLYVAMSGAKQISQAHDVNTNNLANASTNGFKADFIAFTSQPVTGSGYNSRVVPTIHNSGTDTSAGTIISTENELDIAVDGDGWLAVQDQNGIETYTREGNLKILPNGQLVTNSGHPLLGNSGPIVIPMYEKLDIASDGTISIRPVGQAASTLAVVDRIKLVEAQPEELEKSGDGLMRAKNGQSIAPSATVNIQSGMVEASNVNAIESMVTMIELSRQYELNVKMMNTAKEIDESSMKIIRMV